MKKLLSILVCIVVIFAIVSCGVQENKLITDDLGEQIPADITPQRIISLTPNITEILFYLGVGDKVVARTSFCNYPPEVESIPVVGDMMNLSVESILDFDPDLVIANRGIPMEILDTLKGVSSKKITVAAFDPNGSDSLLDTIDRIALLCGVESRSSELKAKVSKISPDNSEKMMYIEIWGDPPMTFGANTYGSDLIARVGGKNLGDMIPGDYPTTTHESIIDLNPDIIIIPDPYAETIVEVKNRDGYDTISAVKNNSVYSVNADLLMRPSPRIIEILETLHEIITD